MRKSCRGQIFGILFLLIITGLIPSCGRTTDKQTVEGTTAIPAVTIAPQDLEIDGDLQSFKAGCESKTIGENIQIITLILESDKPATPPEFAVKWQTPSVDVYGFWSHITCCPLCTGDLLIQSTGPEPPHSGCL